MRNRCWRCAKIVSTLRPCRACGSETSMLHCHNRAHRSHSLRYGPEPALHATGYQNEDLGPCGDFHVHPNNGHEHWDEPQHEVTS